MRFLYQFDCLPRLELPFESAKCIDDHDVYDQRNIFKKMTKDVTMARQMHRL